LHRGGFLSLRATTFAFVALLLMLALWAHADAQNASAPAATPGRFDPPAKAVTVDLHDGVFAGRAHGAKLMDQPCVYGDKYHYEINTLGELGVSGALICGNFKGSAGGEEICHLNPQLECRSRAGINISAGAPYSVSESGVKVGGKIVPWADAPKATALFPAIEARAKAKCDSVLFEESKDQEHDKSAAIPTRNDEQAGCKATLAQICASASGRLANGKDVSILCRR
jgi:hypothetical protein